MSLTPTNVLNNSAAPGIAAELYIPDQLIAGDLKLVTSPCIVASGAGVVKRGTVMGVVTATGKYIPSATAAVDGSQTPSGILVDGVDATSADVNSGVYLMGEFNANAMTIQTWGIAALTAALRPFGIFVKSIATGLSNADAT